MVAGADRGRLAHGAVGKGSWTIPWSYLYEFMAVVTHPRIYDPPSATGRVTGPLVHDARVAAICVAHGVRQLWSADREFGRFGQLDVFNPLVPRS